MLTVGRAGSTSLMDALEKFPDIALPNKNIPCPDNELFHPLRVQAYMRQYAALCGTPIARPRELMECFFARNDAMAYAGFKTMPNRHARPCSRVSSTPKPPR